MCSRYLEDDRRGDKDKLHFQFIDATWTEWEERQRGRNEPINDTYPNYETSVIIGRDGTPAVRTMRWGFPPPFVKNKAPVINVRNLAKGYWREWLGREQRGLVSTMAFSVLDQVARAPWFRRRAVLLCWD